MVGSIQITFKKKFLAGLFVTIPAVITILVIAGLFKFIDGILSPFFDFFIGKHVTGLGFIAAITIIFFIGLISTNVIGKKMLNFTEKIFLNIPILKSIYTATKQLVDAFSPENKGSFKKFVIIRHPISGTYAFGFLTKECVVRAEDKEFSLKAVYVPTNHLYLGDIVLLEEDNITYTDIPVEEGIKIILSGGTAAPSNILGTSNKKGMEN